MLWTLDLKGWEVRPAFLLEWLDEEERSKCARFRREEDRLAYAAAHALLRCALGQTLGLPPASLRFARDNMGKPLLAGQEESGIDFSLSHTTGMVAVALCDSGSVGVDVEAVDQKVFSSQDVLAFGLSAEEAARLAALSEPKRSEAFADLWTVREAVAKADGRGLSLPLARIRIDACADAAMIAADEFEPARNFHLWRDRPTPGHRLALAADHDMQLVLERARLHPGPAPHLSLGRGCAIASFELG